MNNINIMKFFFIFIFGFFFLFNIKGEVDSNNIKLTFKLYKPYKKIVFPIIDANNLTISYDLNGDTLCCELQPIIKNIPHSSGTMIEGIQGVLYKKRKYFVQVLSIPFKNLSNINYIEIRHETYKYIFQKENYGETNYIMIYYENKK